MRAEIFYLLVISFFVLLVASDPNGEKLAGEDYTTCLSVDLPNGTEGVIPEIKFTFKSHFPSLKCFLFLSENFFGNAFRCEDRLSRTFLKSYQFKRINLKAIKEKPFRLILCMLNQKQDDYDLV